MMKQGLGNALDRIVREVLHGKVRVKQKYKGRERESLADIWKKRFPTEDIVSTKALGSEHFGFV